MRRSTAGYIYFEIVRFFLATFQGSPQILSETSNWCYVYPYYMFYGSSGDIPMAVCVSQRVTARTETILLFSSYFRVIRDHK